METTQLKAILKDKVKMAYIISFHSMPILHFRTVSVKMYFKGEIGKSLFRVVGVFLFLCFLTTIRELACGLPKEQDAKTSKSPEKIFFLFLFSPLLILSFLKPKIL